VRMVVGLVLITALMGGRAVAQPREEAAEVLCPSVLGIGEATRKPFCDVSIEVEPERGIRVVLPRRRGDATLSFDLHNRHTYSREQEVSGRAYAKYLATVAVATFDGEVLAEGVVMSEFRSAEDLVDRIIGGAGPSGLKAVAPLGTERVSVTIPASIDTVVIVGRSLEVAHASGREAFTSPGRPIAVMSDAVVTYRPRS